LTTVKKTADYREGPEAADRFENALDRILKVSKEELAKREAAYQKSRRAEPRRGPRPRARHADR